MNKSDYFVSKKWKGRGAKSNSEEPPLDEIAEKYPIKIHWYERYENTEIYFYIHVYIVI